MCAVILCWLVRSWIGRDVSFDALKLETQNAKQHKIKFWSIKWKKAEFQGEAITRGMLRLQLRSADAPRLWRLGCKCIEWSTVVGSVGASQWFDWSLVDDWLRCICALLWIFRLTVDSCDGMWIFAIECEYVREYLRLIVNMFSWLWCVCLLEANFPNLSDWMWTFANNCEYF